MKTTKPSIYEALAAAGRGMTQAQIGGDLRSLATDSRFAAVVGWIGNNREVFARTGSSQGLAEHHGPLAHCAGSVYALDTLTDQLRALLEPRAPSAGREKGAE